MADANPDLPALAVFYSPEILLLDLVRCGAGVWTNIWLIDRAIPGTVENLRILKRLGTICDVTGLDAEQIAAQLMPLRPQGVLAFSDPELVTAAILEQHLGLPGHSVQTAQRLTDKAAQREALKAAGLAAPGFLKVAADSGPVQWRSLAAQVRFPVVVKPQAGRGSRNVSVANGANQLISALGDIVLRRRLGAVVEERLTDLWPRPERPYADFVSVESVRTAAGILHLGITGRSALAPPFRETGSFMPACLSPDDCQAVELEAERAITALGTGTGMFHTEVKLTPNGPRIIEVNGRVGGMIPEIAELAGGHQILNVAGRVALGQAMAGIEPWTFNRVSYSHIAHGPMSAVRLTRLDRLDAVEQLPGVGSLYAYKAPGDPIDWREGYNSRLFVAFGSAATHDEMWSTRRRIQETVAVEYDYGLNAAGVHVAEDPASTEWIVSGSGGCLPATAPVGSDPARIR